MCWNGSAPSRGVEHVLATADPHTILIECALGLDIREAVASFAVGQGWGLLELKPLSMTLEDVFLRLTQREDTSSEPHETAGGEHHS